MSEGQRREVGVEVVNVFVWFFRRWRLAAVMCAGGVIVCLSYYATLPPSYEAEVKILPQDGGGGAGLLGRLAGLDGFMQDSERNLEGLYKEIVFSDSILDIITGRRWACRQAEDPVPLWDALNIERLDSDSPAQLLARTKRKLRRDVVSFHRDFESGFMVLRVTVEEEPELAANLANGLVDELNRFNIEFRTRKSREKRVFIENRLGEVDQNLKVAATALSDFVSRNRDYSSSPSLIKRYSELEREVQAQTSIWIELRRQLELVRIDENRELMSVDILDRATVPMDRSGPLLVYFLAFGIVLGILMTLIVVAFMTVARQVRTAHRITGAAETASEG